MAKSHDATQRDFTCPLCLGVKDTGLLLCLPCHHRNAREDGTYPDHVEAMIDHWETVMLGGTNVQSAN